MMNAEGRDIIKHKQVVRTMKPLRRVVSILSNPEVIKRVLTDVVKGMLHVF